MKIMPIMSNNYNKSNQGHKKQPTFEAFKVSLDLENQVGIYLIPDYFRLKEARELSEVNISDGLIGEIWNKLYLSRKVLYVTLDDDMKALQSISGISDDTQREQALDAFLKDSPIFGRDEYEALCNKMDKADAAAARAYERELREPKQRISSYGIHG
ncbi:MAG: hypothetical protein PHC64_09420 [Candidatus Gastranaerophilales bacterium]|nr:hypothetical protein [Candidatus Gastranaerophilales bacterium]